MRKGYTDRSIHTWEEAYVWVSVKKEYLFSFIPQDFYPMMNI